MADLPRVIDNMEALPEPLRDALKDYFGPAPSDSPHKGKLILLGTDPNIEALQGVLTNEREQRRTAVAETATLKTKVTDLERKVAAKPQPGTDAAEWEQKLANLDASYNEKITALTTQVNEERTLREKTETTNQLNKLRADLVAAGKAAGASDGGAEDLADRMLKRINSKDGKFVPIKPDGTVQLGRKVGPADPMTWKELAEEVIAHEASHLLRPSGGGGAGGGLKVPGGGGGEHTIRRSEMLNVRTYREKRDAATKAGVELQVIEDGGETAQA